MALRSQPVALRIAAMVNAEKLKSRTKALALRVIHLFRALPDTVEAQLIGKKRLRSSTAEELQELIFMFSASLKTVKNNLSRSENTSINK